MGKASSQTTTTTTMNTNTTTTLIKNKKKKGRPSLLDLQNRALLLQQQQQQQLNQIPNPQQSPHFPQNPNHRRSRSSRRTPHLPAQFLDGSDSDDDDYHSDSDDDERVEKKVKLVVRLPSDDFPMIPKSSPNSSSFHSFNSLDANHINNAEDEKDGKATDTTQYGTTRVLLPALDPGPTTSTTTTPLPDRKLLLLILDKLQKKDTRGVFAEPVDPEELPDYHEVIENPMDFSTVRKKLDGGFYSILEQLEADIYLICSNAMQYNAPSTIYFRQARSIQELAKKEFDTVRQEGGLSEPPPKPRRGRPPGSRNYKKLLQSESSPVDRGVHEPSPDVTPVSREDDATRSNAYNLRKGPSLYRFPRYLDNCFDYPFLASSSKSTTTKYGKKQCGSDESKRETYSFPGQPGSGQDPSLTSAGGSERQLIAVGLDSSYSYARSLAVFAADLGPVVWRIVSKKIRSVLPPGVDFGPGWVGETKAFPQKSAPHSDCNLQDSFKSEAHLPSSSSFSSCAFTKIPSTPSNENLGEVGRLSSPMSGEWSSLKGSNGIPLIHPGFNGFSGGYAGSPFQFQEASRSFHGTMNEENDMGSSSSFGMMPYWQNLSIQERWDCPFPAELNLGHHQQASGSRNSSLPIGSPPQLDLVLQL